MLIRASGVINTTTREFGIGIPPQNLVWWHGGTYYLFWLDGTTLSAFTSNNFTDWTARNTNGASDFTDVENNGRACSFVFGERTPGAFAWAMLNRTSAVPSNPWLWVRWPLADNDIGTPITNDPGITAKNGGAAYLTKDLGGLEVNNIYGCMSPNVGALSTHANRANNPGLSADTPAVGFDWSFIDFPEENVFCPLTDGFINFANDEGESGDLPTTPTGVFGEAVKTNVGDAWGAQTQLDAAGDGNWRTQNYASSTSHIGQNDWCQLDDGTLFHIYVNNADQVGANFGLIRMKTRGTAQAGTWSTVTLSVDPDSSEAWHVSVTTDGVLVYIAYVKDVSGIRDTKISLIVYDPAANSFSSVFTLAEMNAGRTFNRMCSSYRCHTKMLFAWNETDGAGNYDIRVAEFAPGGGLPPQLMWQDGIVHAA